MRYRPARSLSSPYRRVGRQILLFEGTELWLWVIEVVDPDSEVIRGSFGAPVVFGVIFDRHFESVFMFCSRRVDRTTAEDVAGETFRRAFEGRHSYDVGRADARPWLFGIARNIMRHDARRSVREAAAYGRLRNISGSADTDPATFTVDALEARSSFARLRNALALLDPEELEPLLLHAWDDLSYKEVAEVMGIPVGTVRSRIHRTRAKLVIGAADNLVPNQFPTPGPGGR